MCCTFSSPVCRYALRHNASTDSLMDSSNVGEGVPTGSTVTRDTHSDATSHNALSDTADRTMDNNLKDEADRALRSGDWSGNSDVIQQEGDSYGTDAGKGGIAELKSMTENAYGGGLYGTEDDGSPPKKPMAHASDFQSAEGPSSDMPKHKDVRSHSSGDRGVDITGQSYIQ